MMVDFSSTLTGFNVESFNSCLDGHGTASKVQADVAFGTDAGIRGTPALFVDGKLITGFHLEELRTMIRERKEHLADQKQPQKTTNR